MRTVPALLCRALILLGLLGTTAKGDECQWRKLPPLPGRTDSVGAIALDGDTLWGTGGNSLAYWTGSEWRVPADNQLKGGQYLTRFIGGKDRPLLFSQRGQKEHEGRLFRLTEASAKYLAEFHYDEPYIPPYLGVTRSSDVYSISSRGISVFSGGQWTTATVPDRRLRVFETDGAIHFYHPTARKLFRFEAKTGFHEQPVDVAFEKKEPHHRAVLWGADRVLVMESFQPGLRAFLLASGQRCDVGAANAALGKLSPTALRPRDDGSVWVFAENITEEKKRKALFRIRPTGECEPLPHLAEIEASRQHIALEPKYLHEARDGALWIAGQHMILTRIADGKTTRFGRETGYDLADCTDLVEDSRGTVYVANTRGIYAWSSSAAALVHLPPPRIPTRPEATWIYRREKRPPLVAAWKHGTNIYAASKEDATRRGIWLTAVDTKGGRSRFTIVVPAESTNDTPWLVRHSDAGILELALAGQILRLSAETGERREELALKHDQRIAPLPVGDEYLIVPEQRGTEIICVNRAQKELWRTPLPGYVQLHPTLVGQHAIVQTRGSSYGGQETLCIRLDDGAIVWKDQTNAYGVGVDFFDESRFFVEANSNMSPQISEGWLIARDPNSGRRLWDYRQSGLMYHPPIIDRKTGRVYAVFQRGDVVCLRGEDGSVVWHKRLSENALASGGADSYHKAWSPHSLDQGRLFVVDQNLTLHAIDAATGDFQTSVTLVPRLECEPTPEVSLVAPPWIIGDTAFAALSEGVISFRLAGSK